MKKPVTAQRIPSLVFTTAVAVFGLASAGCSTSTNGESCSQYPQTARLDDAGNTLWTWYYHWKSVDLASLCAGYGTGAKMVLEVDYPQNLTAATTFPECTSDELTNGGSRVCAMANVFRFEADCAAGEMLVELPNQSAFHGYYHIESAQIPAAPRVMVSQDTHCSRDLYVIGSPPAAPAVLDAGMQEEASSCASKYPSASRVDDTGVTQWWWYFDWRQAPDLATVCGRYGADAKVVLEVDTPKNPATSVLPDCTVDEILNGAARACAIAQSYRYEAVCTAGELLFEMPSENTFHGYYHVEGSLMTAAKRVMVNQDVHCSRDVYAPAYSSPLPV